MAEEDTLDFESAQRIREEITGRAEHFNQYWASVHDEASSMLVSWGITPVPKPEFTCPRIDPQALATADLQSYGVMHARVEAWYNYADYTLAWVKSSLICIKRQMEQLLTQLLIEYGKVKNPNTNKPYSVADRKALAENTPRYIELLRHRTYLEAQDELAESRAKAWGRDCALISRHIELRKLDIENGRVGGNIPNRGQHPGMSQPGMYRQ